MVRALRRLAWKDHAPWLGLWLRMDQAGRDGRGTPYSGVAEQADTAIRRALARFDIEDTLAEDPQAAFVAFTVGLAFRDLAKDAALQAERAHLPAGRVVQAVLTAALQRLAWRASQHYAPAYPQPEPFGVSVPVADLPPLVTTEESTK